MQCCELNKGAGTKRGGKVVLQMYRITKTMPSIVRDDCTGVWAELGDDIRGVLPYLNAVVKEASYDPQQRSLSFRRGERGLSITPCETSIAQATSMEHAQSTVDELRDDANENWERRETITAFYKCRKEAKVKDMVMLLSQTNCKECGLPTCFAFTMTLRRKQKHLKDCTPLRNRHLLRRGKP